MTTREEIENLKLRTRKMLADYTKSIKDLSDFKGADIKAYVINSYLQLNAKQFLSAMRYQHSFRHMWE